MATSVGCKFNRLYDVRKNTAQPVIGIHLFVFSDIPDLRLLTHPCPFYMARRLTSARNISQVVGKSATKPDTGGSNYCRYLLLARSNNLRHITLPWVNRNTGIISIIHSSTTAVPTTYTYPRCIHTKYIYYDNGHTIHDS